MFPNTPSAFPFWSASARAGTSSFAWQVDFINGVVIYNGNFLEGVVRCVRGS